MLKKYHLYFIFLTHNNSMNKIAPIVFIIIIGYLFQKKENLSINSNLNNEIINTDIKNKSIKKNNSNKPIDIHNIQNEIKDNHKKLRNFPINSNDEVVLYENLKKQNITITLIEVEDKYCLFYIIKDYFINENIFNDNPNKKNIPNLIYSIESLTNTLNELEIFKNTKYKKYLSHLETLLDQYKIYKEYLDNNITD